MADLIPFLGRFHVVVLHLPIGLLTLTAGLEIYFAFARRSSRPATLTPLWLLGTLAAAVTCGLGYLLSLSGGYAADALSQHLLGGVATTFIALVGWVSFALVNRRSQAWRIVLGSAQLITLTIAGHLGGNLTHGSEFLWAYAPSPLRTLAGFDPPAPPRPTVSTLDEADVFLDIVQPILEQRCTSCHNPAKTKGELLLTTYENILAGGESGPAVVPGNPAASELSRRINLDPAHDDFMPSGGKTPLTPAQTDVLDWWIQSGTPPSQRIAQLNPPPALRTLLTQVWRQTEAEQLTPVDSIPPGLPPLADATIAELDALGFDVKRISLTDPHLDVDYYRINADPISDAKLQALIAVRPYLTHLNLGHSGVTDAQLPLIAQLTELTKLSLDRTPITDAGLTALHPLQNLQTIVLHSTALTNESIPLLDRFPQLQHAYLWGTAVTVDRPYIILGP